MRKEQPAKGAYPGKLTLEEANSGHYGIWTIGDQQPKGAPGYSNLFQFKTWFGHPKKYENGHLAAAGPGGIKEFVMVMDGYFRCTYPKTYNMQYPASVDLPDEVSRTWWARFPNQPASGFTIRRRIEQPISLGEGHDYELHILDVRDGEDTPAFLLKPDDENKGWRFQYVEVFRGALALFTEAKDQPIISLFRRDHLYLDRQHLLAVTGWSCSDARGVVLYY